MGNLGEPKTPSSEPIDPWGSKNFGSTPLGGPLEISVDGLPKFSAVEFGSNHEHTPHDSHRSADWRLPSCDPCYGAL